MESLPRVLEVSCHVGESLPFANNNIAGRPRTYSGGGSVHADRQRTRSRRKKTHSLDVAPSPGDSGRSFLSFEWVSGKSIGFVDVAIFLVIKLRSKVKGQSL